MSDVEILQWARGLHTKGYGRISRHKPMNRVQTRKIVNDLLLHAQNDGMSGEDVRICRRALELLK